MKTMNVSELLDAAKARQGLDSDNRLALALVVSRSNVSQWRNGSKAPDAQAAMKLADMAQIDRLQALAICEFQRETDPKRRQYWATFLTGLRRLAAVVVAGIAALILTSPDVSARTLEVNNQYLQTINSRTNRRRSHAKNAYRIAKKAWAIMLRLSLYQGLRPRYPHRA